MEKIQQREKIYKVVDIVAIVVVLVIFGITYFLPKSGENVLVIEILNAVALLLYGIFTLVKAIVIGKNTTGKSIVSRILIIGICLVIGVLISKNVVLDMANGPTIETVTITSVTSRKSSKSFVKSYHVSGYNEDGERVKLEVSEEDAMRLASRREAKLEYYENTGRLIAIR